MEVVVVMCSYFVGQHMGGESWQWGTERLGM